MGLIASGLGPGDQSALRTIEPKAIQQLRLAAQQIQKGKCRTQSLKWFGDKSPVWMGNLSKSLNKMASIINTKPIQIVGTDFRRRATGTLAAAQRPRSGWGTYTHMSRAQGQNFRIRLDIGWNKKPLFSPSNQSVDSKYLTIIHEVTHLVLDTDDVNPRPYGFQNCVNKARNSPANAKKNADNWAYFVDNFQKIEILTYQEWMQATKRGIMTPRSSSLKKIDKALEAYDAARNRSALNALQQAINAWIASKGQGWRNSTRNRDGIVERLVDEVNDAA